MPRYGARVPITVGDLLEMPHLQLRLHSGGEALDRAVDWTHTTDLPEPWRWIAGGELLMTNGMPVPQTEAGQEELILRLVEHGAAGLAIGEEMYCPPLTPGLARASDELRLPVLWVAFPMPFVAISRAVAEATLLEQSQRLIRTERIYKALQRVSAEAAGLQQLTGALARELNCAVRICDRGNGDAWYPGQEPLADHLRRSVGARRGHLHAGVTATSLEDGGARLLLVDVPTHADAVLVALPGPGQQPDALLLQHAATVCALALSQARLWIEQQRRAGAELLAQILDGQLAPSQAERQLEAAGLRPGSTWCAAATNTDDPATLHDLHLRLWRDSVPHISVHRAGLALTLIPADPAAAASIIRAAGSAGRVGLSNALGAVGRLLEAEREARWALRIATERASSSATYGEATPWLGPRTPDEAKLLVDQVLGEIRRLPQPQASELIGTLRAFLDHGRSWQKTAAALHVHRQTVLYRVRKIEELTGRTLADTADLATVWLAIQAMTLLEP